MFGFSFGRKNTSQPVEVDAAPDVVDLYNRGTIACSRKQFEKAIEFFTQALDKDPKLVQAYINRGNAYSQWTPSSTDMSFLDGILDKAIADYSKAIELDPVNGMAFGNRALTKYIKGDYAEAFADLQESKRLGYHEIDPRMEQNIIRRGAQRK